MHKLDEKIITVFFEISFVKSYRNSKRMDKQMKEWIRESFIGLFCMQDPVFFQS